MKITVRGFNRDMGEKEITRESLSTVQWSETGGISRNNPAMYRVGGGLEIAWFQRLSFTGNYRMELSLSQYDIMRLFKSMFGTELRSSLLETEGFTMSPEFLKAALRTVKLTDLTLGDLVAMNSGPSDEDTSEATAVKKTPAEENADKRSDVRPFPFPRRMVVPRSS